MVVKRYLDRSVLVKAGTHCWSFSLGLSGNFTQHSVASSALPLQPAKTSLTTPGASCILPDGQGFFSFGFRLTQQRWHTPIYVTHHRAVSLRSVSFEWLLSYKCDTVTFFKGSGREGSIFINLWNRDLTITEWFVPCCLGAHCCLQPWKTPVPGTGGTWCKTLCHGLASHHTFAGTPEARYAGDAMSYPGALLTPCQSQAGRSCWGRCLPISPSRSPAEQWLSSRGAEVQMESSTRMKSSK